MEPRSPSNDDIIHSVAAELPCGVWVARAPGGEFVYANQTFQDILGMGGRDDVASGEYAAPYGIHDRSGELYPEDQMPFMRALRARREVIVDDIVIHPSDGRRVYIRATARPVFDAAGEITHVVIAFIDISREAAAEVARAESEARARHAERMQSIGTFAGGIAHDFNNLLAAIKALTSVLLHGEADPGRRHDLESIDAMTVSAAALTRSLLSFAGRGRRVAGPVVLSAVVQRMAALLDRTLDRQVRVQVEAAGGLAVLGDEMGIEQVVMNLAVNAREAMPDGGDLTLRTRDEGDRVVLEVEDGGRGVPAALRARIFEPYFTTKPAGAERGTGLGLATVHGIVQQFGGTIEVLDRAPTGTTMRITFPGVAPAAAPTPAAPAAPAAEPGRGLVLVVDDDAPVREATARLLASMGYEALEADGGLAAVERYRLRQADVRAVLLDLTMPGMDGPATLEALRALDPDVRVLVTTGFEVDGRVEALRAQGCRGVLAKPYARETLADALAAVLR
jgi:two-component system cell cycle sensor histidine kinase/response regulator CckA